MSDFDMFQSRSYFPVRSFKNQLDTSTTKYLQETFKIIYNTDDLELLTKFFSALGFYLLSKNTVEEKLIKHQLLYEKIFFVLNSGMQVKTTLALNLISSLLYFAEDKSPNNNSYIYIQNMIRISGCLKAMCNLFTSFMLHKDTLTALCRSVSEVCRGSSTNQTYCSYLVPVCIQKCRLSWEVFSVLQSLLLDHDRNTTLFYETNGMKIFTRDSLQNLDCLHLLNTVIENIKYEHQKAIRNESHLFDYLSYQSRKYNGSTLVGKWTSIILYSYRKVSVYGDKDYFVSNNDKNGYKINSLIKNNQNQLFSTAGHNDTNELFRNIVNEIVTSRNQKKLSKDFRTENTTFNFRREFIKGTSSHTGFIKHRQTFRESVPVEVNNDLTFSFLLEDGTIQKRLYNNKIIASKGGNIFTEEANNLFSHNQINQTRKILHNHTTNENKILIERDNKMTALYCSTPKPKNMKFCASFRSQNGVSNTCITGTDNKSHDISRHKNCKSKQTNDKILNKRLRNKSLSSRFLDIVNASCTTIIKSFTTFQNIFKSKNEDSSNELSATADCNNYSFTDFMREKDIILHSDKETNENKANISSEMSITNSCNTCNNTIALKQKYVNNSSLQRTIKKLILGINLYGCDFKKISRNMWPLNKHMTPQVLYNLYRKLIIK